MMEMSDYALVQSASAARWSRSAGASSPSPRHGG